MFTIKNIATLSLAICYHACGFVDSGEKLGVIVSILLTRQQNRFAYVITLLLL